MSDADRLRLLILLGAMNAATAVMWLIADRWWIAVCNGTAAVGLALLAFDDVRCRPVRRGQR